MSLFFRQKKIAVESLTDEDVVERIVSKGEQQYLEVLYDRYSNKIYHKCLSLIKDAEASKDCTHDIIMRIFTNLVKFQGRSSFSLWVHSITYNYCMDYLQKRKRIIFNDYIAGEYDDLPDDGWELEWKQMKDLQLSQLEMVFQHLGADEQLILMMRYQDGMSVKDIAESLEIGESAVKMRLKRSRDHLAELINQNLKE